MIQTRRSCFTIAGREHEQYLGPVTEEELDELLDLNQESRNESSSDDSSTGSSEMDMDVEPARGGAGGALRLVSIPTR